MIVVRQMFSTQELIKEGKSDSISIIKISIHTCWIHWKPTCNLIEKVQYPFKNFSSYMPKME